MTMTFGGTVRADRRHSRPTGSAGRIAGRVCVPVITAHTHRTGRTRWRQYDFETNETGRTRIFLFLFFSFSFSFSFFFHSFRRVARDATRDEPRMHKAPSHVDSLIYIWVTDALTYCSLPLWVMADMLTEVTEVTTAANSAKMVQK